MQHKNRQTEIYKRSVIVLYKVTFEFHFSFRFRNEQNKERSFFISI